MNFTNVQEGKNSWKRYVLSLVVMIVFITIAGFPYAIIGEQIVQSDGNPNTYFDEELVDYVGLNPLVNFALMNSVFVFWLIGIFVAIRFVHKRKIITLITPKKHLDWKRIGYGFGAFFLILSTTTILDVIFNPGDYSLNDIHLSDFVILFFLVLILTPIQTTCEEVFFRGYLMQFIGKWIRNPLIMSLIAGGIFGSLHFTNPEMNYSPIFVGADYLLTGIIWCYISAKTNSIELSIGAHAANNMFLGWFLTMDDSVMGGIPSLFLVKNIDPLTTLIWDALALGIFLFISLKKYKEKL
ncbi:CPBP family intramembrane metalloprotease [Bacillus sp. DNRA2]|uniref:CPBP family intramembrane glutamic endopeptidase n=1 Tax=Bacillus sp. DNRA2 TaxID=2723053 RepID=UPI00145CCB1F|nr:CPBP family intramembrane glutamic endopeptidase [Bacillus sp. DNRA2]NMD69354.1 CPBP family intramembrane metalloprotease [Bacillus sp. DNRA2]